MRAALALFVAGTALLLLLAPGEGRRKSRVSPEPRAEAAAPPPAGEETVEPPPAPAAPAAAAAPDPVSGTVVSGGRPVAGAIVWFRDGTTVTTGADGRYAARSREGPGGAWHPELGCAAAGDFRDGATLDLVPGFSLEVVLLDRSTGSPVSDATIRALLVAPGTDFAGGNSGEAEERRRRSAPETAYAAPPRLGSWDRAAMGFGFHHPPVRTGAAGTARLSGLPERSVRFLVEHPAFAPTTVDFRGTEAESRIVVRLEPAASLLLLAPRVEEPLVTEISTWGRDEEAIVLRLAEGGGSVVFSPLPAGEYIARAFPRAGASRRLARGPVAPLASGRIRLAAGERATLDLTEPQGGIAGRIRAARGGVEGLAVTLLGGRDRRDQIAETTSNGDGAFSFEGLPPGGYRLFVASEAGWSVVRDVTLLPGERNGSADLVVRGAVVAGEAAGGSTIQALRIGAVSRTHVANRADVLERWLASAVAADGRYRLEGLPAGAARIWSLGPGSADVRDVDLRDGEERRVDFPADSPDLFPVALSAGGHARPRVCVAPKEGYPLLLDGVVTGSVGLRLPRGDYLLSAAARGCVSIRRRPFRVPDSASLEVEMRAAPPVTVRLVRGEAPAREWRIDILDPAGLPVDLSPAGEGPTGFVAAHDGTIRLDTLGPGTYRVFGAERLLGTFEVADGPVDVTLEVP